jgi:hypothetical protein
MVAHAFGGRLSCFQRDAPWRVYWLGQLWNISRWKAKRE